MTDKVKLPIVQSDEHKVKVTKSKKNPQVPEQLPAEMLIKIYKNLNIRDLMEVRKYGKIHKGCADYIIEQMHHNLHGNVHHPDNSIKYKIKELLAQPIEGSRETIARQLTTIISKEHFPDLPHWVNVEGFMTDLNERILWIINDYDLAGRTETIDFTNALFPLVSRLFNYWTTEFEAAYYDIKITE
jgi:hypothetical protein